MGNQIKINDFVWAKITGHPPWPSLVIEPGIDIPEKPSPTNSNLEVFWIYFFGTHNYAWVEENHLKPYDDYKDKYISLYKTDSFEEAVEETEDTLDKLKNDSNYKVFLQPFRKIKRKRSKNSVPVNSGKRPKSSASSFMEAKDTDDEFSFSSARPSQSQLGPSHEVLKTKNITTSNLTFGVIGIGIIGSGVVKHLIQSGHKVNIWNRTTRKCSEIEAQLGSSGIGYLRTLHTPRAVMENSDIVCNCVSDHNVSKKIIQNYFGINNASDEILNKKGFVEMTSIDPEASKDIRDMIEKKGGKYLEAQLQGSKKEALHGRLVVLAAGNQSLFFECQPCFKAIGSYAIFLGDVGYATKINLILQLIRGVCLVGLAEGMALAERCGLSLENFLNIFHVTNLAAPYLKGKANTIMEKNFHNVEQSLQTMQKDMKLGLEISNRMGQPMEMAAAANEIFKHCRRLDFDDQDASCIYMRTRF